MPPTRIGPGAAASKHQTRDPVNIIDGLSETSLNLVLLAKQLLREDHSNVRCSVLLGQPQAKTSDDTKVTFDLADRTLQSESTQAGDGSDR